MRVRCLLVLFFLVTFPPWGSQRLGFAQISPSVQVQSGAIAVRDHFIGAPQVLEIPIHTEQTEQAGQDRQDEHTLQEQTPEQQELYESAPPSSVQQTYQQTYLGLRYATADACLYLELSEERLAADHECFNQDGDDSENDGLRAAPEGVKVLSVIVGSPGERAGFQGADAPAPVHSHFVKAGIAILAMSPVGPLAIPLAMAYDVYTSRHIPGDLIIAVDGESVHTAQEFNALMNRYQPGTAVTFSVMRKGEPLRLTARLEAEPLFVE